MVETRDGHAFSTWQTRGGRIPEPQDEIVADLARKLVADTAPQELPLFRATSSAYFRDPQEVLARRKGRDEMLGFGVETAVVLLTPVALEVAKTVVSFVAMRVRAAAEKGAGDLIEDKVAGVFAKLRGGGAPGEHEPDALEADQLAEVGRIAFEKARQLDVPENKASLLADSVVGSLATA
jgi:hypothetical protein